VNELLILRRRSSQVIFDTKVKTLMRWPVSIVALATISLAAACTQNNLPLETASRTFETLYASGNYKEAESVAAQAVNLARKNFDAESEHFADSLNDLAKLYLAQGLFEKAEMRFKNSLTIYEKLLGPQHPKNATSLNNLALVYDTKGRHKDAGQLYKRSLTVLENAYGSDHQETATALNNLGNFYRTQGRYDDAESLLKQALKARKSVLSPEHPEIADSLNNLAKINEALGRYDEAELLFDSALDIYKSTLGPDHRRTALARHNLAELYYLQGRYVAAEALHKRALDANIKSLGLGHPRVALSRNSLALLYKTLGRYAEAETQYKASLEIYENTFGFDHLNVAQNLNNLGELFRVQGRHKQAEPLFIRSLAIYDKALGPQHPSNATSLNNLALLYGAQSRHEEAGQLYKRSLTILEKALGPSHQKTATALNNLGEFYRTQGRYVDAEPLLIRALKVRKNVLGPAHPDIADSLNNLALVNESLGRFAEAGPLFDSALDIYERSLGSEHPNVALTLHNLATLYQKQGRYAEAYSYSRENVSILRKRFEVPIDVGPLSRDSEQNSVRFAFLHHLDLSLMMIDGFSRTGRAIEAFEIAQLTQTPEAARAISLMAARFSAGNRTLVGMIREQQDIRSRINTLNQALITNIGIAPEKRDGEKETRLRTGLSSLDTSLVSLNQRINEQFPSFGELVTPKPITLPQAQKLLGPSEALVLISRARNSDQTHVFILRNNAHYIHTANIGSASLQRLVIQLRKGTDLSAVNTVENLPVFNTSIAYKIYQFLFGPAEPILNGVNHVFIVADNSLGSLPFGVLVTEKPKLSAPYHEVAWFAARYAATTLPSVSSLHALRTFGTKYKAKRPFVGFGDPNFGNDRRVKLSSLSYTHKVRGFIPAPESPKNAYPRLQETADELHAIADALGANGDNIYLYDRATEDQVKSMGLDSYRVIAFATHGLKANEREGLSEPALLLSRPRQENDADDGLLTASEIATLKLNADWVLLTACNTAAGGKMNGEALSGLARAFFYAGSRSLLVSHWPVESNATVALITGMFQNLANNEDIGRSEALRRSMLSLMANKYQHPAFWGAFVVVGEGRRK
jgi:tetratricopeptide (TPR) repeat protein